MAAVHENALLDMIEGAASAHRTADVRAAVAAVRARCPGVAAPEVAIVLGTGLGALGEAIRAEASVAYVDIPGFPLSTVESHTGRLLLGSLGGRRVAAMQGRFQDRKSVV